MVNNNQQPRPGRRVVVRVAQQAGLVILFVVAALLGTLGGVLFAFTGDVPEISALDDYRPNTITRLLARDGQMIGEFATERRVVIGYDDIAPALRNAIIATEDAGFNQHFGLSMSRIIVTVLKDILTGERAGASTHHAAAGARHVPRQYRSAGGVFERSPERKIKEWIRRDPDREAATPSRRSSRSTRTRSISDTARTASKRLRICTSTSQRRSSRSKKRP